MRRTKLIKIPITRSKLVANTENVIPDLAYEISEQSLSEISGGTGPVCASIGVSLIGLSYVTNLITAANSVQPNDDPSQMPPDFLPPQ